MDLQPPDLEQQDRKVLDRKTGITMWLQGTQELETKRCFFLDPRWRAEPIELSIHAFRMLPDGSIDHSDPVGGAGTFGWWMDVAGQDIRDYLQVLDSNAGREIGHFDDLDFTSFTAFVEPALRLLCTRGIRQKSHEIAIYFEIFKRPEKLCIEISDGLAERMRAAGIPVTRIESAPWLEAFSKRLPAPLPPSYATLVQRYAFDAFRWGDVLFLGTSGRVPQFDLPSLSGDRDKRWELMLQLGLVTIAHPWEAIPYPICFDMRRQAYIGEFPIIVPDVPEISRSQQLSFKPPISTSFMRLARDFLRGRSQLRPFRPR